MSEGQSVRIIGTFFRGKTGSVRWAKRGRATVFLFGDLGLPFVLEFDESELELLPEGEE